LQHDLDILIGNVLDASALIDPSKIIDKMKLQLLPSLPDDIRRFGPPIQYSTEIFECYNAIFCLCSVLSNHQAPSCDIANKFTSMDRLKHILSGGYWEWEGKWVCTGPKVRQVLHDDPFLQQHLGWVPQNPPHTGESNLTCSTLSCNHTKLSFTRHRWSGAKQRGAPKEEEMPNGHCIAKQAGRTGPRTSNNEMTLIYCNLSGTPGTPLCQNPPLHPPPSKW
jgi:hypothetical protein